MNGVYPTVLVGGLNSLSLYSRPDHPALHWSCYAAPKFALGGLITQASRVSDAHAGPDEAVLDEKD